MSDEPNLGPNQATWERDALTRLAGAALLEQRRSRRWSIFFRLAFLGYLIVLGVLLVPKDLSGGGTGPHTAVVRLEGVITSSGDADAKSVIKGLRSAFADKNTVAVVLEINSPGGSPVQAGQMHDEILRLREKYPDIPLYSVIDDICASGGYYVAAASERIYADKASIVGSIGVLMNGFGFVETLDKLGIERRLLTAGAHKGSLDPFSPIDVAAVTHIQSMLDDIHQQFIEVVKAGRGERLKDQPELFSGLVWSGEQSLELGLIDGLASLGEVARDIVNAEEIVDFTVGESYLDRLSRRMGAAAGESIAAKLGVASQFEFK
ncbi:MAG: S49 family peptidase [Gammaproteobacteria bacterium]|nr:MAG: S49 family peptidase [Gammaproteobacteria bacterium]RLA15655.1 MAG: S49 family peptidase [Gammaproteobacteria bacterium]